MIFRERKAAAGMGENIDDTNHYKIHGPSPHRNVEQNGSDQADRISSSGTASTSSSWHSAIMAELIYCSVSAGTILFNKHMLSTYMFPAPNALLFFQFALAVLLLKLLSLMGVIYLEPMRMDMVRLWLPVNLIFVAMNVTGFYALQAIGAGGS